MRIPLSDYRAMNKINQIAFRTQPDTAFFDDPQPTEAAGERVDEAPGASQGPAAKTPKRKKNSASGERGARKRRA